MDSLAFGFGTLCNILSVFGFMANVGHVVLFIILSMSAICLCVPHLTGCNITTAHNLSSSATAAIATWCRPTCGSALLLRRRMARTQVCYLFSHSLTSSIAS